MLTVERKEEQSSKFGLAKYYLQFCAVNSQISNHSGALISARKALTVAKKELQEWNKQIESKSPRQKKNLDHEEKLRLLDILCNFNDRINLQLS